MTMPLSFMRLENDEQAEALDRQGYFTTVTRAGTRTWPARQVALLITTDEDGWQSIAEVGVLTRSTRRIATGVHRLHYKREYELEPLDAEALLDVIPNRLHAAAEGRASSGGSLTAKATTAVVRALRKLRPDADATLRRLLGQQRSTTPRLAGDGLQAAAQEADAVRLALDIAGLDKNEIRSVRPDGVSSFIEVLSDLRVPEDMAIAYDSMRFLDFDRVGHPSGVVRFSRSEERLTVININRQPLERTTGADLVYINETAESFVLVQYKTFRREGNETDLGQRLVYRPDTQFRAELARMRKFKPGKKGATDAAFRLHPGCCFLKFCKPIASLDYDQRQLVSGMYLPIEYYDLLAEGETIKGPRGGIALSYETVPRHLSNELFVLLVRGGWIGTYGATTQRLTKVIQAGLEERHSVTVASASRDSRN